MRNTKMFAALLAGLITLSLAGCGADKTENTSSDPASTESGITVTVTDNASDPTAESSLPAENETNPEGIKISLNLIFLGVIHESSTIPNLNLWKLLTIHFLIKAMAVLLEKVVW